MPIDVDDLLNKSSGAPTGRSRFHSPKRPRPDKDVAPPLDIEDVVDRKGGMDAVWEVPEIGGLRPIPEERPRVRHFRGSTEAPPEENYEREWQEAVLPEAAIAPIDDVMPQLDANSWTSEIIVTP